MLYGTFVCSCDKEAPFEQEGQGARLVLRQLNMPGWGPLLVPPEQKGVQLFEGEWTEISKSLSVSRFSPALPGAGPQTT